MNALFAITVWLTLSILSGVIANRKGKSFVGFFLFSMFVSPVIGAIVAIVSKTTKLEVI